MRPAPLLGLLLWASLLRATPPPARETRHGIHWNSSNPRFLQDDYTVQVAINDYLDIYCPHYEGTVPASRVETFTLFMVDQEGYRGCYETPGAFKRWECNRPWAPFGPIRFSEKIQRFTPFPLGFEFQPGETYYYFSVPSPESAGRCLKLRVSVCCRDTTPEPETEVPNSQPHGHGGPEGEYGVGMGGQKMQCPPGASWPRCSPTPRAWPSCSWPCSGSDPQRCPRQGIGLLCPTAHFQTFHLLPSPCHKPVGQPWAMTHPPDLYKAELGPGALGWKDFASLWHHHAWVPLATLPWQWALHSSVDACAAPGPSPHLVPSPMESPPRGAGDPQALEQGCRIEAGAWSLHCLVLRRGHTDLSSGKTLLRFGFNPW